MYERYKINKEINFRTVIPFHTLFLELANKELYNLPKDSVSVILEVISTKFKECKDEKKKYSNILKSGSFKNNKAKSKVKTIKEKLSFVKED